jgi:hypothetical protein
MEAFKVAFGLCDDDIRTPVGAENGPDVIFCNQKTRELVGLAIEVKNQKNLSIWAALDQAKQHCNDTLATPSLVFRRSVSGNRDVWIAVPLSHYLEVRRDGE